MNETIKSIIPQDIQSNIVKISKNLIGIDTTGHMVTKNVQGYVMIPSRSDVLENKYTLFNNLEYRIKKPHGVSFARDWWLSDGYSASSFYAISRNGYVSSGSCTNDSIYYVAISFCT